MPIVKATHPTIAELACLLQVDLAPDQAEDKITRLLSLANEVLNETAIHTSSK